MNPQDRTLWPFGTRVAIGAAFSIFFVLLLALIVLRIFANWPSQESERIALLGILLVSLIPILLTVIDTLIERGSVFEYRGVKIDFSQNQMRTMSDMTIPANIGMRGEPVGDSGTVEILDSLRKATNHAVVIVDLEDGHAWWETRLLVLLAGAVWQGRPEVLVFVGTEGGDRQCFQGWAHTKELLPNLLTAHPNYPVSYQKALVASRQWGLVQPTGQPQTWPTLPPWMKEWPSVSNMGTAYEFATGLPNQYFAEQVLASELGIHVESPEKPRNISLVRLADLFKPVLHQEQIDETWPPDRQIETFFESDAPFVAFTEHGQFRSLVSRVSVLNAIVGKLARRT